METGDCSTDEGCLSEDSRDSSNTETRDIKKLDERSKEMRKQKR
jgi:hypothetical protein